MLLAPRAAQPGGSAHGFRFTLQPNGLLVPCRAVGSVYGAIWGNAQQGMGARGAARPSNGEENGTGRAGVSGM